MVVQKTIDAAFDGPKSISAIGEAAKQISIDIGQGRTVLVNFLFLCSFQWLGYIIQQLLKVKC